MPVGLPPACMAHGGAAWPYAFAVRALARHEGERARKDGGQRSGPRMSSAPPGWGGSPCSGRGFRRRRPRSCAHSGRGRCAAERTCSSRCRACRSRTGCRASAPCAPATRHTCATQVSAGSRQLRTADALPRRSDQGSLAPHSQVPGSTDRWLRRNAAGLSLGSRAVGGARAATRTSSDAFSRSRRSP